MDYTPTVNTQFQEKTSFSKLMFLILYSPIVQDHSSCFTLIKTLSAEEKFSSKVRNFLSYQMAQHIACGSSCHNSAPLLVKVGYLHTFKWSLTEFRQRRFKQPLTQKYCKTFDKKHTPAKKVLNALSVLSKGCTLKPSETPFASDFLVSKCLHDTPATSKKRFLGVLVGAKPIPTKNFPLHLLKKECLSFRWPR